MLARPLALAAAILAACQPLPPKPQPRAVAFDLAAYEPYGQPGTAVVEGQAFLLRRDGGVVVGAGRVVELIPRTAYGQEALDRMVLGYVELEPCDPRLYEYVRETQADGDGRFSFEGVPAGAYYAACRIVWEYGYGSQTGGIAFASFDLAEGEIKRVNVTR